MCACSCDPVTPKLVTVNQDVAQIIVQTELKQTVAGACNRPAVGGMVINIQAMGNRTIPETPVVVGVTTAAILYAVDVVVIVHHFVQKGGGNFFNGPR